MATKIKLADNLRLVGLATHSAFPGESVRIEVAGFHSSAEGNRFARAVDSLTMRYLKAIGKHPWEVDHLLVVMGVDGFADIYCNELTIEMSARTRAAMQAGEEVIKDHIAEVAAVDLGVEIPNTSGFFFIFSLGWNKGILFDFGPLQAEKMRRVFDVRASLGIAYTNIIFSERFVLTEPEWADLIARGWFLFLGLPDTIIERMVEFLRIGRDIELLVPEIEVQISKVAKQAISMSQSNNVFSEHTSFLERALERFEAGDYVSAGHIIFPRIEGMLRSYYTLSKPLNRPNQKRLLSAAFPPTLTTRFQQSVLRPDLFSHFVKTVIFPDFDWQAPIGSTRHTIGHGVVAGAELTGKTVSIAFLTVHHLLFALPTTNPLNRP